MRRKDRELTSMEEIKKVIAQCRVLSLALHGGDFPYVIPVNFGVEERDGKLCFYFHSAPEGMKLTLIRRDSRAAFCMSAGEELVLGSPACRSSMKYESVCGRGRIAFVEDVEEKRNALAHIMKQYDRDGRAGVDFDPEMLKSTVILCLTAKSVTGKSNRRRAD